MDDISRARSALQSLDAGCPREQWVHIGMAAKAAGLGFDDFHEWSQGAGNYIGQRDCHSVWNSFSETGGVSAASLYAAAFKSGWQDPAKRLRTANGGRMTIPVPAPRKAPVTPIKPSASERAGEIWERCIPAPAENEYIARKGGLPDGLRIYPLDATPLVIRGENVAGWLAVPCRTLDGMLQTIQFVPPVGDKLNLPSASFGEGFFTVGDLTQPRQIYVVEGIGQGWAVHAVTDAPAVVCFGAGRMRTVAGVLRKRFPAVSLVLVPDRGKEQQVAEIARTLDCSWVAMPEDQPSNFDANDVALLDGGLEELAAILAKPKSPPMRFQLLSAADLANTPPLRWMVRGVLPVEGLAALYGQSGSGKSFLVLDLAAAIAGSAGDWFARRVTPAAVTYVALEGEAGLSKRLDAWRQHHKKPTPEHLRFVTSPFNLLKAADVEELARGIKSGGGAGGLVIIDTLNRSAPGADENSSVDMGNLITAAKQLQSMVGGLVLLVHHSGKDASKGLRGHSSSYAALDAAIEVSKTDARREWSIAKSKDDETGAVHAFRLEVVSLGMDDEGEEVTSCVVVRDETREAVKRVNLPGGGNQILAVSALAEPLRNSKHFGKAGAMPGRPCLELEEAVRIVADCLTVEPKRRNARAREALTGLIGRGVYSLQEGWLSRCD